MMNQEVEFVFIAEDDNDRHRQHHFPSQDLTLFLFPRVSVPNGSVIKRKITSLEI